jgi:BolA protein
VETPSTVDRIRQELAQELDPLALDLIDESDQHAGHAGAQTGGGHYRLRIVSARFEGKTDIERHRLVYAALGELMGADIHALSIQALAPSETS